MLCIVAHVTHSGDGALFFRIPLLNYHIRHHSPNVPKAVHIVLPVPFRAKRLKLMLESVRAMALSKKP